MNQLSRRQLLRLSGMGIGLGALAACGGGGGNAAKTRDYLTWWDHQGNQGKLHEQLFAQFAKRPGGMRVQYTFRNASQMGQALQLAKQSNQLPDVHTNAGLLLPVPQLIAGGFVAPLDLSDPAMARIKKHLVNGIHVFDGKLYGLPQFDYHSYTAVTWFNTKIVSKAGLDPDNPPATYDDFRAACRKVQKSTGGKTYGWIWNAGMPQRMEQQVDDLAQAAGFAGSGGMLFKTGEYDYDSDPYLNVIEFLLSLSKDKLMFPGSINFSDQIARTRWATGVAAYYTDGPWNPGVIKQSLKSFAGSLGVGPILLPQAGMPIRTYASTQPGVYWLSPTAPAAQRKAANALLSEYFTTHKYYVELTNAMPMPTVDPTALAASNAYPSYKKMIGWMAEQVFLAPQPIVGNVEVSKVQAQMKPVQPGLGDIVQGVLSGKVTDIKGALKQLSDSSNASLENAIKTVRAKGVKVSQDDFAFPNWTPGADYTTDKYPK